jgi:hypothetical protein
MPLRLAGRMGAKPQSRVEVAALALCVAHHS